MSDIEIMNDTFGALGYFGSIVRSKFIVHNIFIGRRRNFRSKQTHIHGPIHK